MSKLMRIIETIDIVETDDGYLNIILPKTRINEREFREQIVALMFGWA